jgi:CO dehydrogenase/acetyl-CoA synthase beta subunit
MQANRVMREYLRIDPFDIWYENLYTLVKEYVDENPSFRIEDLAKYLQGTYLSTQRGSVWDYVNTHTTYLRLQARYPDLPNSIGRRQ